MLLPNTITQGRRRFEPSRVVALLALSGPANQCGSVVTPSTTSCAPKPARGGPRPAPLFPVGASAVPLNLTVGRRVTVRAHCPDTWGLRLFRQADCRRPRWRVRYPTLDSWPQSGESQGHLRGTWIAPSQRRAAQCLSARRRVGSSRTRCKDFDPHRRPVPGTELRSGACRHHGRLPLYRSRRRSPICCWDRCAGWRGERPGRNGDQWRELGTWTIVGGSGSIHP